jgi:hypothetical protein
MYCARCNCTYINRDCDRVSKSSGPILLRVPMLFGIIKLKASMGEPKGLGGENR